MGVQSRNRSLAKPDSSLLQKCAGHSWQPTNAAAKATRSGQGPPTPAPVGVSFDYPWLIQTVRNLSWPTVTQGTVMTNAARELADRRGRRVGRQQERTFAAEADGFEDKVGNRTQGQIEGPLQEDGDR